MELLTRLLLAAITFIWPGCVPAETEFVATAYSLNGLTASGTVARRGIVAADPDVLPLGTKIKVSRAGKYSGIYRVEDTGSAINGYMIDIKMGSYNEAMNFGRRKVLIEVVDGPRNCFYD